MGEYLFNMYETLASIPSIVWLAMMVEMFNPNSQEAEAGGSEAQQSSQLHSQFKENLKIHEVLSQKTNKNKNDRLWQWFGE